MAAVAKHRSVGGQFQNEKEIVVVRYDYATDGGATGALDLLTAVGNVIIVSFYAYVVVAPLSTGSATIKVGVTGNDDLMITVGEGAKANYALGAVLKALPTITLSEGTPNTAVMALPLPHKLANGEKVLMTIGTEVLSVGTIDFVFECMRG